MQTIQVLTKTGSYLRISPQLNLKPSRWVNVSIFALYCIGFVVNSGITILTFDRIIQKILRILRDFSFFCNNFYIFFWIPTKTRKWLFLTENLENLKTANEKQNHQSCYVIIIVHIIFFIASSLFSLCIIQVYGFIILPLMLVELFQAYTLLFYLILAYAFLFVICEKYELQKNKNFEPYTVKKKLFILSAIVKNFNEIFGWPLLFNVTCCGSGTLIFLDTLINSGTWAQSTWASLFGLSVFFVIVLKMVQYFLQL